MIFLDVRFQIKLDQNYLWCLPSPSPQLTLDIIGKAVFNYDFNSLTTDSPLIQAVYTALKETETRATDLLPYWKVPLLCKIVPRQQKATAAVELIRQTTADLIRKVRNNTVDRRFRLTQLRHPRIRSARPWWTRRRWRRLQLPVQQERNTSTRQTPRCFASSSLHVRRYARVMDAA